jgi:hypothetical protein
LYGAKLAKSNVGETCILLPSNRQAESHAFAPRIMSGN